MVSRASEQRGSKQEWARIALLCLTLSSSARSPRCRTHLCCCQCCGRITQPTHTHLIHRTRAAATEGAAAASSNDATAASADPIRFSFSRCTHCAFPSLLPASSSSDRSLPPLLLPSASSPLLWPLPRVLAVQVILDCDAAVQARTTSYLAKLDEFRALSRSLPSSGSQQQQQQALHYQRAGGAQGEESKSQEESSPPSSANSATQSAAAIASRVEQQLLHSRDQLLQCIEAKERWAAVSGTSDAPLDAPGELAHPEFTATHLRLLQLLCGSTAAPAAAASTADDSSLLLPSALVDSISQFLSERRSILEEKQAVETSWRIVQSVLAVQADRASSAAAHAASAASAHAAAASTVASAASTDLSALSVSVLLNVLHCRFQRAEYLLQLRVEPFHRLLASVADLLLRVYDAMAAAMAPAAPVVPPPAPSAPAAVHAAWKSIVDHSAAIAHAAATPLSWRSVDLAAVTVVEQRSVCPGMQHLAPSDLIACAESLQLLYCDVHATIALHPHNLEARKAALFPVASAAAAPAASSRSPVLSSQHQLDSHAAAAAAADDGDEEDVSMSPPVAATPSAAQITPRPQKTATSARKARMQQHHPHQQQRYAASTATSSGAIKFPNALYRAQHRPHPYVQR